MKSIGVFLSSLTPKLNLDNDLDILAGFISESKLKLVYGGGKRGLMGELSEKVSKKNGRIKGITLPMFDNEEIKPNYLDEEEVQTNFYLRKKSLIDQSDFFVVMHGVVVTAVCSLEPGFSRRYALTAFLLSPSVLSLRLTFCQSSSNSSLQS